MNQRQKPQFHNWCIPAVIEKLQEQHKFKRGDNIRKCPTGSMVSWGVLFGEKLPHHSTSHENMGYFHSLPIITKSSRKIIMQVFWGTYILFLLDTSLEVDGIEMT